MSKFNTVIRYVERELKMFSKPIHTQTWQSTDISQRPEAEMREVCNVRFVAEMESEDLDYYRVLIHPNLPWADSHFERERVSGQPINPGHTWKEWPYGNSATNFLEDGTHFSHTYAERYWPKQANDPTDEYLLHPREGIRYAYGDLGDVINLLRREPLTRQAYLPVWFPEDTGVVHGKRVPCTLGYHFMMRDDRLNVFYPIRSCDYVRHFRDDLYLTVRLVLWMIDQLRQRDDFWNTVKPGELTFWAGSMHCFINDWRKL